MREPWIVERTGLSVREHQDRTVANFAELCALWDKWDSKFVGVCQATCPFMPVLQGWTLADYFLRTSGPIWTGGRAGLATLSSLSATGHSECRCAFSAPIADSGTLSMTRRDERYGAPWRWSHRPGPR
jgi:hypothetical protein